MRTSFLQWVLNVLLVRLAAVVVVAIAVAAVPGLAADQFKQALSAINPFDGERVDRTGPAVLQKVTELAELKAASGHYELTVDIDNAENDNLPGFITDDKVVYAAKGDVDVTVDLRGLRADAIEVNDDQRAVALTLPAPQPSRPNLDVANSRFVARDTGLLTKLRGSDLEQEAQTEAVERLAAAARADTQLAEHAEASARRTLTELMKQLGYEQVKVEFEDSPEGDL